MDNFLKRNHIIEVLVIAVIVLGALGFFVFKGDKEDKGEVIATVNSLPIYKKDVEDKLALMLRPGVKADLSLITDNLKKRLIKDVATDKLLLEKAKKEKDLDKNEIEKEVKEFKEAVYRREFLKKVSKQEIKDEEVKVEYDKLLKQVEGRQEARASHILLKTKEEADAALNMIQTKSFEEVAKEVSIDKATANNGGDVGYFSEGQMIKEFSDKAFSMKPGEVSKPVKSQFGWHIIKLVDIRPMEILPYDEIKDRIEEEMLPLGAQRYIDDLLDSAKFDYMEAKSAEAEKQSEMKSSSDSESKNPDVNSDVTTTTDAKKADDAEKTADKSESNVEGDVKQQ